MLRRLLYSDTVGPLGSVGVAVLRIVVGIAFVLHGWPKIQDPTGWMGDQVQVGGLLQSLAAIIEFVGGIALVLGLFTRLAAFHLAGVMMVALAIKHVPEGDPFVGKPGEASAELATAYLACMILFMLIGAGRVSLDAIIFAKRP